jgi:rare lipoprotein A (peptidoglycan hydrolase)
MTPRHRLVPLLACVASMAAPAAAAAQTPPTGGTPAPPPSPTTVVANNGQVAIITRVDAMLRRTTRFRGSVAGAEAGRTVTIELFDPLAGSWSPVATATVGADGSYLARWRTDRMGVLRVRATVTAPGQASAASASPEVNVTVYRSAVATWYGPGFYGHKTACGAVMTHALLGVAHKTLPCGTPVAISYKGRHVTVPVVDRGPFAHGASYDLTSATAQQLGFTVTDRIGALPQAAPATP